MTLPNFDPSRLPNLAQIEQFISGAPQALALVGGTPLAAANPTLATVGFIFQLVVSVLNAGMQVDMQMQQHGQMTGQNMDPVRQFLWSTLSQFLNGLHLPALPIPTPSNPTAGS
jgi:hypothetical protein